MLLQKLPDDLISRHRSIEALEWPFVNKESAIDSFEINPTGKGSRLGRRSIEDETDHTGLSKANLSLQFEKETVIVTRLIN